METENTLSGRPGTAGGAPTVADADIFLFPSRYDIFGLVIVEAMGAGLATVVLRSPGGSTTCVSRSTTVSW